MVWFGCALWQPVQSVCVGTEFGEVWQLVQSPAPGSAEEWMASASATMWQFAPPQAVTLAAVRL